MNQVVLDASVTLAWCFEDEATPYTNGVLQALPQLHAAAPALWALEVSNALLGARRRQRLKEAQYTQKLAFLRKLPISLEPLDGTRAFTDILRLAEAFSLTTYDAAYLELARRLGAPLATLDGADRRQGLKQAAAQCGVVLHGG